MKPQPLRIISELYYPEETSTGYFLTGIAEGLAADKAFDVSVLCAQPSYSQKGTVAAKREHRKGVEVRRLDAPVGDKNQLFGRLWNTFSLSLRFGFSMLGFIRRGDIVMVVTNPPSLPLLVGWIAKLKGAVPVLLVHDVYPDVLVPTGFTREGGALYRMVDFFQRHMLRQMKHVVVLGRDMEARLRAKLGDRLAQPTFSIIPNWGEVKAITPKAWASNPVRARHGLEEKFIIQFSGNLGRTHGLEDLVTLIQNLKNDREVHFLIFGWGAGRDWLAKTIEGSGLANVTLLPPCEKAELGDYLTACDLFFMPFKQGMEGISVPSRLYNVMAAGNPILAITGAESELAQVVSEESIGWVVSPSNVDAMLAAIAQARQDLECLEAMRGRARAAAETKYTREMVVERFKGLFGGMNPSSNG